MNMRFLLMHLPLLLVAGTAWCDQVSLRPPGSDWLFAKLYCGRALEESLIAGPLRSFATQMLAAATADAWFFIR